MIQEDKDLLLRDLSARLPYGVKVCYLRCNNHDWYTLEMIDISDDEVYISTSDPYSNEFAKTDDVKPYLFPLSSMTEDQALELYKLFGIKLTDSIGWDYIKINEVTGITFFLRKGFDIETHIDKLIDWLLKNHFDFRGLIPKGLALDATGLGIY